jgi:hypothetical protein
MNTTKWIVRTVVVAVAAAVFCPSAQAVPISKWCFTTPLGTVCVPLDNIDLSDIASPEDECGLYPPGPRCGNPTMPPYGATLEPMPGGEWSLKLPDGRSVSPVIPVEAGGAVKPVTTPSDSWDGRGQGVR